MKNICSVLHGFIIFALLLGYPVFAQESPVYLNVEFQIASHGKLLAQTSSIVLAYSPASLEFGNAQGEIHKFDYEIKRPSKNSKAIVTAIMESQLFEGINNQWVLRASPMLEVGMGKPVKMKIQHAEAGEKPVDYEIDIRVSELTEGQVIDITGSPPAKK